MAGLLDRIKHAANEAAKAIVGEYDPLLGEVGTEDDSSEVIAKLIGDEFIAALMPAVIDSAEVWDSDGTLALQINGYDVLYLSKCPINPDDPQPSLSNEQHQQIIDAVCKALKVAK